MTEENRGRNPDVASAAPQRLSLRTLLVRPARQLRALVVPLVVLLFLGGALDATRFVALPLAVAAVAAAALVRWATFTYRVRDDQIEIVHGLLNRQARSIPLDRVRGVDVTASLLHRLLGIAVLRIEAAAGGETQQEGELDAVTSAEAERLRTILLSRAPHARDMTRLGEANEAGPTPQAAETEADRPQAGATLARLRPRWYLYAPLTPYLFVPLALFGGLVGFLADVVGQTGALSNEDLRRAIEDGAAMPYLLVMLAGLLLVLTAPLVAIAAFAVTNWRFTLRLREGSLVGERGLFSRRSVSLARSRIRGWELREGLLLRTAGGAGLRALATGLGDVQNRADLLPVAPRAEALRAAARSVGRFDEPLLAHPRAARTRRLVRAVGPWLGAAVAAELIGVRWLAVPGARWLALALLVLAVVGVPLGLDRYRSLGHASDGERLSVRSGSLLRQQVAIERRAVVGWTFRQTWLQRRAELVTLVAGVGAGAGGYPAVDVGTGEAARFAAEVSPAWVAPFLADRGARASRGGDSC